MLFTGSHYSLEGLERNLKTWTDLFVPLKHVIINGPYLC